MSPFLWSLLWNLIIWFSLVVIILWVKKLTKIRNYLDYITALTVWLLLWIVFLGFFPEIAHHSTNYELAFFIVLLWVIGFYVLELFLHWHHCKDLGHSHEHKHDHESSKLIFVWTFLHNLFHWFEIFVAFAIDTHFWFAVTLAILLHSIPQNIVNYFMNHHNLKIVIIWALAWVFWSLLTLPFSGFLEKYNYLVLAFIAWGLLYTALADIFPSFKSKWTMKTKFVYLIFVILWAVSYLWFAHFGAHEHVESEHEVHSELEHNEEKHLEK